MAVEMIEHNELSALGKSRVGGLKQFVDDKNLNFVGNEGYMSLVGGSRQKKKSAARQQIIEKYSGLATECPEIATSIEVIQNDLQTLVGRSNTATGKSKLAVKEQIDETTKLLGEFKSRAVKLGCEKAVQSSQSQKSKEEILQALTNYGSGTVEGVKSDLEGSPGGGMNKILLYGGIGLGVVLIAVIIYKANKK